MRSTCRKTAWLPAGNQIKPLRLAFMRSSGIHIVTSEMLLFMLLRTLLILISKTISKIIR